MVVHVKRLQTIQPGSQIFDSYGQKCNHRFLLNYGFAVENNTEIDGFCPNEVPIELTLSASDPLHDRKLEFWCQEESPYVKRIRVCISNNENTKMLFSMLRVVVTDEKEFNSITAASATSATALTRNNAVISANGGSGCMSYRTCRDIRFPLSLRNEKAALSHLRVLVWNALSLYPSTLAQDNIRLADSKNFPAFSNARHAVIQVRGEKEVLHYYEELATTALRLLDLQSEDDFDASIKSLEGMGTHHLIVRYCSDVISAIRRKEQRQQRLAIPKGGASTLAYPSFH